MTASLDDGPAIRARSLGGVDRITAVVHQPLRYWAAQRPTAPFVKCRGDWVTYAELDARSDRVAAGLAAAGVRPGDRVAVVLDNCDEFVDTVFACSKLGATQVPLNTYLSGEFLRYQLTDCGATTLIADRGGIAAYQQISDQTIVERVVSVGCRVVGAVPFDELRACTGPLPDTVVTAEDIGAIVYTSGTTGMPKGCMLSHGYLTLVPSAYLEAHWVIPGDRICTPFPLFHLSGQTIVMQTALQLGISVFVTPSFSASTFMCSARDEGATMLFGIGAMAMAILAQPVTTSEPRGFRLATWIPMTPEAQLEFERRFDTPTICEGYGQTECAPAMINHISGDRRRQTSGKPVPYLDIAVVDDHDWPVPTGRVGEIVIRPRRPEAMYSGYWGNPVATTRASRNLWHHTGDYAYADEDGFITFTDRKKDALRRRGENVSSLELEKAILDHPRVAACAVHAVASRLSEDDIKACIVPAGEEILTVEELFDHFVSALPYFAVPAYVEFLDALPTNALGRVMKHELRARGITPETIDLADRGLVVRRDQRRGDLAARSNADHV